MAANISVQNNETAANLVHKNKSRGIELLSTLDTKIPELTILVFFL